MDVVPTIGQRLDAANTQMLDAIGVAGGSSYPLKTMWRPTISTSSKSTGVVTTE
jgi:hypothetical protein